MKQIMLISGKAECGKSASAKILKRLLEENNQKVVIIPFAKYLKLILQDYYDWDGITKDKWFRTKAQFIGTDKIRKKLHMPLFHCMRVCDDIKVIWDDYDYVIVDDCRFRDEAYYCSAMFPDFVKTVRIERLDYTSSLTEEQLKHISETDIDNFHFDYIINSKSGLDNLENEIEIIMENFLTNELETNNIPDFVVGDKVEVIQIMNTNKAGHLKVYIGRKGYVFSWIIKENVKRYKIIFGLEEHSNAYMENDTAYFTKEELEICI